MLLITSILYNEHMSINMMIFFVENFWNFCCVTFSYYSFLAQANILFYPCIIYRVIIRMLLNLSIIMLRLFFSSQKKRTII